MATKPGLFVTGGCDTRIVPKCLDAEIAKTHLNVFFNIGDTFTPQGDSAYFAFTKIAAGAMSDAHFMGICHDSASATSAWKRNMHRQEGKPYCDKVDILVDQTWALCRFLQVKPGQNFCIIVSPDWSQLYRCVHKSCLGYSIHGLSDTLVALGKLREAQSSSVDNTDNDTMLIVPSGEYLSNTSLLSVKKSENPMMWEQASSDSEEEIDNEEHSEAATAESLRRMMQMISPKELMSLPAQAAPPAGGDVESEVDSETSTDLPLKCQEDTMDMEDDCFSEDDADDVTPDQLAAYIGQVMKVKKNTNAPMYN